MVRKGDTPISSWHKSPPYTFISSAKEIIGAPLNPYRSFFAIDLIRAKDIAREVRRQILTFIGGDKTIACIRL